MDPFEADRRLRVGVLFSGSASGFQYLTDYDPNFNETYEVVVGISSSETSDGIAHFEEHGVPVEIHDIESFYAERGAERTDLTIREAYDEQTRDRLRSFSPDVLLLSGYMWIVTEPVFASFPTINVHPADLTIKADDGSRKYVGYNPVKDAVLAGEPETRSTVHFVTSDVDEGPLLVRSRPFPVHEPLIDGLHTHDCDSSIEKYVSAHQEWMKWEGDGPSIAKALELLAGGRVDRVETGVRIDGKLGVFDLENTAVTPIDSVK